MSDHNTTFSTMLNLPPNGARRRSVSNSLGGKSYDYSKRLSQQMMDSTPEPIRSWLNHAIKHDAEFQSLMRSESMAEWFEFVGSQIELFKHVWNAALTFNPLRAAFLLPDAELTRPEYNHQFLVEDKHGKIVAVTESQLLELFPQADPITGESPKQLPRVVFTSSHARGENLRDVTTITHGIERMISDATDKQCKFAKVDPSQPGLGVKPDETLIVFRCDVRANPWLNGAELLRRNNELKHCQETGAKDEFKECSPGSWAISHLIQAMTAQSPSQVLKAGAQHLAHSLAPDAARIELRPDAARVAQHIFAEGYSKGGTVISDAVCRILPDEYQTKDAAGRDAYYCMQDGEMRPITKDGIYEVRKLVRQIPAWAMASVEFGLTDAQIAAGARRVAFNSEDDTISAHSNYTGRRYDERWIVKGVKHDNGHHPEDALGTRKEPGYAGKDPRIARRQKEMCAPMIGKATLDGVRFDQVSANEMVLEAGAGTSDRLIMEEHADTILAHLKQHGLSAKIENPFPHSGEYHLEFDEPIQGNRAAMKRLQQAFRDMRANAPGLVISDELIERDLAAQLTVNGRAQRKPQGVWTAREPVAEDPEVPGRKR